MNKQPIGNAYIDALKALHVPRGSKRAKKRPRTALISEAAKRKIAEREGRV